MRERWMLRNESDELANDELLFSQRFPSTSTALLRRSTAIGGLPVSSEMSEANQSAISTAAVCGTEPRHPSQC